MRKLDKARIAIMQAARKNVEKKDLSSHTVGTKDGKTKFFKRYGRKMAMAIFCTECMGWEADPKECGAQLCPLFPDRTRTQATNVGDKVPF